LSGEFNVPIGTKTSVLLPDDDFKTASSQLRRALLTSLDFQDVVKQANAGDFIFADPPYTVRHNLNGFIRYNERLFSWSDQIRLRDALFEAKPRGVIVFVCNANHSSIRDLYRGAQELYEVGRHSVMAARPTFRQQTTELLIRV